jgi:hypothetical protein
MRAAGRGAALAEIGKPRVDTSLTASTDVASLATHEPIERGWETGCWLQSEPKITAPSLRLVRQSSHKQLAQLADRCEADLAVAILPTDCREFYPRPAVPQTQPR